MSKFTPLLCLLALVAVANPVLAATALPPTPVAPADIKATFGTSKPFTATSATGGKVLSFTLNVDGTASQSPKGSKATAIIGTWRVNDKGYCSKWATNAEHCYTMQKNGTKYEVLDASGQVVSRWVP